MKTLIACALTVLVAGCHDGIDGIASPGSVTVNPAGPTPVVQVPVIEWGLNRSGEHPGIRPVPTTYVSAFFVNPIDVAKGGVVVAHPVAGQHIDLSQWGWGTYEIRGFVAGVPSAWFKFELAKNADTSDRPSTDAGAWGPVACTPESFLFSEAGDEYTLHVQGARTGLRVMYSDPNHGRFYQAGQPELLDVVSIGETHDLADRQEDGFTDFQLARPVEDVTIRWRSGSLYRVCVAGQ